jgi:RNA polymerase sigma-70 factor (ECF subfamily)
MAPRAPAVEVPSAGDDERLLIEAAQRDPVRFGELYERNFDGVYAFVARRAGDRGEAEDLTAEVFRHALANLARFEWRGLPFLAWLLQIARHALADRWQRAARERGEPVQEAGEDGVPPDADRRAMLSELVSRLPRDQQQVIVARFIEQKSNREIASELGRTEGAVKQLQFRALANLRARMGDVHE